MTPHPDGGHGRTHGQTDGLTDDIRRYWDKRGRRESIVAHDGQPRRSDFREHPVWLGVLPLLLAPSATGRPLRRVADMGCGTGILAEHLARLGYGVIAVEFAESRAALARQRLAGCRAGSGSWRGWRRRWCASRKSCCSTSRPARSTCATS